MTKPSVDMEQLHRYDEAFEANKLLLERNRVLEARNSELEARVATLEEHLRLLLSKRYSPSSERTHPDQIPLLFNEAELEADKASDAKEPTFEEITYRRRKQKGQRDAVLCDLPEEIIEHEPAEEEKVCPQCDGAMHQMSTEERRELKFIPAHVKVTLHIRPVLACRRCQAEEIKTPVVTTKIPEPPIPGSLASASAIAYVMTEKYVKSVPLYRQEQELARLGVHLPRQTLSNWVLLGSERWLSPIYQRMHHHLLAQEVLHADETTLQVLHEAGRSPQTKSFMWLYRTGRDGPPIVLYEYQPTRAGQHPVEFLSEFSGFLHADGYAGYEKIPGVTLVGCLAHMRRKFDEALKALPSSARSSGKTNAEQGLHFCNRLYKIEDQLKGVSADLRHRQRALLSKPLLEEFHKWLLQLVPEIASSKGALGKAVNYSLNQWDKLLAVLQDGRLEIDNNRAERSIKPFVIGRKNWLFANTPKGATASAVVYSVIETAKENHLKPFEYLTHLFEQLPNVDVNDPGVLDALLPWSDSLPEHLRQRPKPSV